MPDENKFAALREMGYRINPSCGICNHGRFAANQDWGGCALQLYQHRKHTCDPKQVSIHKIGTCPSFEPSPVTLAQLGAYLEFFP